MGDLTFSQRLRVYARTAPETGPVILHLSRGDALVLADRLDAVDDIIAERDAVVDVARQALRQVHASELRAARLQHELGDEAGFNRKVLIPVLLTVLALELGDLLQEFLRGVLP